MISNFATVVFFVLIACCVSFLVYSLNEKKRMQLIKKLYIALCLLVIEWSLVMIGMRFTSPESTRILFVLDSLSYIAACTAPPTMLLIAVVFVRGAEKLPEWWKWLLVIPVLSNIIVWTNPLHHLHYRVFSIIRSEIVFGPHIYLSGFFTYFCLLASMAELIRFGLQNRSRLYWLQVSSLSLGALVPLAVSFYATFSGNDISIAATPFSFIVTLACNYFAIYRLHLLDIIPIATQHVLDWISDGYLIVNSQGLVVDVNKPFRQVIGKLFGITDNRPLEACLKNEDVTNRTALYNLIAALRSSGEHRTPIAYEQALSLPAENDEPPVKYYYLVDITPLDVSGRQAGYVVIFKDITQVRRSMQQVQEGQARMMEQERLAMLGQMVGGLAHNLKTPIMSIAGCSAAIDTLLVEAEESLGDRDVTDDDYREIYGEIDDWLSKIRSSCSYMSDIITAIKGQAANASNTERHNFSLEELLKRTTLLMHHELLSSGCTLVPVNDLNCRIIMRGDINSIIQVLNNLISNAIDAEHDSEKKEIRLGVEFDNKQLSIYVQDTGHGFEPRVRDKLFQEMITTKGAKGTGLGLYISNSIIRGKFGGSMWLRDNPEGGSIIGFSIPTENDGIVQIEKVEKSEEVGI